MIKARSRQNGMTMKRALTFISVFLLSTMSAWGSTLNKAAEWPFSEPILYLKGGVNAVTGGGNLLFWAVGDTISVIDKNSFTPMSTFRVNTSTTISDMLYDPSTSTLYIAAGYDSKDASYKSGGFQIYSLTDPSNPKNVGGYYKSTAYPGSAKISDTEGKAVSDIDARGLGLYNGIVFLADNNYGLRVIDVSDPTNLKEVPLTTQTDNEKSGYKQPNISGSFLATGGYVGLSVYPNPYNGKIYACVLDYYHGVDVFDVTIPSAINAPEIKDTRTSLWYGSVSLLSDIFVTSTGGRLTAFVDGANSDGSEYALARLDIVDNTDTSMTVTNYGFCNLPGDARGITVSGNYAYVAVSTASAVTTTSPEIPAGLQIVDISKVPSTSVDVLTYPIVGSYTANVDFAYSVFLDGTTLYLASGEAGLNKIDVQNVTAPIPMASLDSPLSADDVAVSSDTHYTYMLDRKKGLRVFNSLTPQYPLLHGYLENVAPETQATGMCVSGNYAYISYNTGKIKVVDVSNPDTPVFTSSSVTMNSPQALTVSGNYLYIADGTSGLHVIDITDPLNPVDKGQTVTAGPALSVVVENTRVYVSEGKSGLEIFDVSNPAAPVSLGIAPMTDARAAAISHFGNLVYAFVADGSSGLAIQNVTTITSSMPAPTFFKQMDNTTTQSPFTAVFVTVLGNDAFVSMGKNGVLALDITSPTNPTIISHYISPSYSSDIASYVFHNTTNNTDYTYATVADGYTGFKILYVYNSTGVDTTPLSTSQNSGCFIETPFTERGEGWLSVVTSFIDHMFNRSPIEG
jgi:hypothetical protein